jgi:hypothetical protein
MAEERILKNAGRIQRNDPCPSGSGKTFDTCHRSWADQERARLKVKGYS